MFRYQNNSFRVLGLQPNVSMSEIMQRVNEIKVKKSLGMDVAYEYDFPWMGALDRSEQNVINALQRLENPVSRLREEIFWFWFETDCDVQAINFLAQNNRQAAHNTWKTLVTAEDPTKKSMSAFMNQAILAHSSVIGKEIIVRYGEETSDYRIALGSESGGLYCPKCKRKYDTTWKACLYCSSKLRNASNEKTIKQKKRNIDFDETHWRNWRFVINRLTLVASKKIFWEIVKKKAEKINDPRLSCSKVDEIGDNFLQDIAEANVTFMSQALISRDYERAKQHSGLLNGASLPSEVLRKGFNRALMSQVSLLNRYSQNATKDLEKVERSEKNAGRAVINIYSKLADNVTDVIYEGNLVDINSISDFALAKDGLAKVVRDSAIVLNNILVADTALSQKEKENEYFCAYEMIKKAFQYAGTTYTKQKYEKDEELIKNNLEVARAYGNYYNQPSSRQSSSKFNWKPILGWGAVILFFVIIANLPDNSSSNKSSTRTSSYSSTTTNSEPNLHQLRTRIENLADAVKKKEARLLELESTLKSGANKVGVLKSEIEILDSRLKSTWLGKDQLINEYNQKVAQYNYLLNSYNNVYSEYQSLYNEYKRDIATHDILVESYNKRVK